MDNGLQQLPSLEIDTSQPQEQFQNDSNDSLTPVKLRPQIKAFCDLFLGTFPPNALKAYMTVYKTQNENHAGVSSHLLLKNPKVQLYIDWYRKNREREIQQYLESMKKNLIDEFRKIAFVDGSEFFKEVDGDGHAVWVPLKKWTPEMRGAIQEIALKDGRITKVKLYSKVEAGEKLAMMAGMMNREQGGVTVNINVRHLY